MHLIRIVVGFCVTFVILFVVTRGVTTAGMFLAVSIVCTAGVALVVWIPAWWIVGWLTLAVVGFFTSRFEKDVSKARSENEPVGGYAPVSEWTDLALEGYLRKAETKGLDPKKVTDRLLHLGWSIGEIQTARKNVGSSTSKANKT
jgi:hypothetical protein